MLHQRDGKLQQKPLLPLEPSSPGSYKEIDPFACSHPRRGKNGIRAEHEILRMGSQQESATSPYFFGSFGVLTSNLSSQIASMVKQCRRSSL